MNIRTKKTIAIAVIAVVFLTFTAVGIAALSREASSETLVIYNWADYIEPEVLDSFAEYYEEQTGNEIKIIYSTFDTNETMMTEIIRGDSQIDLICPSDYALQKLLQKGKLIKLDRTHIPNIEYVTPEIYARVDEVFPETEINGKMERLTDYFTPYMWGTLGILYNTDVVTEEDLATGWGLLWNESGNPELEGKILVKDSVRDVYAATMTYLLEQDMLPDRFDAFSIEELINHIDADTLTLCEQVLTEQRDHIKGYEVDFGKDDMITGVAYVDLAWSGDALWAMEESEGNLDYFVPETGGNVWFDGWAIPTSAKNVSAANMFINYLCRPDIAMQNSMNIGYTCSVAPSVFFDETNEYSVEAINYLVECEYAWELEDEKVEDGIYFDIDGVTYDLTEFFGDERRYPDIDSPNFGVMKDFGADNEDAVAMWERVKGSVEFPWGLIITLFSLIGAVALTFGVIQLTRYLKQRRHEIAKVAARNMYQG